MSRIEFEKKIEEAGLTSRFFTNGYVEIGKNTFANPLIFFNRHDKGEKYNGEVSIKAINRRLFSPEEVAIALDLSHAFLNARE